MRKKEQNKVNKSELTYLSMMLQLGAACGLSAYALGAILELFPTNKYPLEMSLTAAALVANAWRTRNHYLDEREAEDHLTQLNEEEDEDTKFNEEMNWKYR